MRASTVEHVLRTLGSYNPVPRLNSAATWGSASCPLAPWTHGGGRDANPSLMVNVEPGGSVSKCMSCGFVGGMGKLAREVHHYGGIDAATLEDLEYLILLEESHMWQMADHEGLTKPVPETLIANIDTWHPYWESRGIDRPTARKWRLGYDGDAQRALLPFFDLDGNLVGVVGRDVTGKAQAKYMVLPTGFDRARHLYGEHRVTGKEEQLLVVEGYLDAVTASMHLPPTTGVVALGSAIPSDEQVRRLKMLTNGKLVIGLDKDESGERGALRIQRKLTGSVKLGRVDYGEYKDANAAGAAIVEILNQQQNPVFDSVVARLTAIANR